VYQPFRILTAGFDGPILAFRWLTGAANVYSRPLSRIFFLNFGWLIKKFQLISGLAEYSRNLRNSAGIWLTNDKFG